MTSRPRRDSAERDVYAVDRLAKKVGRYALVVGVAKRARDLRERIDSTLEPSGGGLIRRALNEIARGDVRIKGRKPDQESD